MRIALISNPQNQAYYNACGQNQLAYDLSQGTKLYVTLSIVNLDLNIWVSTWVEKEGIFL